MTNQSAPEVKLPDPIEVAKAMAQIAERSQRLVTQFLGREQEQGGAHLGDPLNIGAAFLELTARLMANPTKLVEAHVSLWREYMNLWQSATRRILGEESEPVARPKTDDRRFKDKAWAENPVFDFIKQSYLLTADWVVETVREVDGLDDKTARKVEFYARQFVDAMAPTNFALTNPEVLRETAKSGGENLLKGLSNLLDDLERGKGKLHVKMTDLEAFELGKDIAVTPGKVVFRNALMELIQYAPRTETVCRRPLLVIPPWINKYYILDLRPENSFVRWATEQGHTVFIVSWVNPDESLAAKSFEDYLTEGPLAALDAMTDATGEREANVVGYCLGGTLLACLLAWLAAKRTNRVASATFLASLVDFEEPGDLGVFIDEEQLKSLEERMERKGYLEGAAMANTFNMLRANDLIWSFVVNNYLLGKEPFPFDLLYWNSDSTRMPAAMHSFYLRKMYQENLLVKPGAIKLKGVGIDLGKIKTPSFILSTREDHIAPWRTTYRATQLYSGPARFTLAASGHIAGVVNPPAAGKYSHWTNPENPSSPDDWLARAKQVPGSWWPGWAEWLESHGGGRVKAREPGDGKLRPIEDAPGSYARVKATG